VEFDFMWVWWAFTIGICVWKLAEGFLLPHRMLEWPFLASAMWLYFYGYMAYSAKITLWGYLGNGITNIGQLMPLLCLVGVLVGWKLGVRGKGYRPPKTKRSYPYFWVWLVGIGFLAIGTAGSYSVLAAANEGVLNFKSSSAYWYLLFYVGYPGLAMAIWSLCKMQPGIRIYLLVITVLGLVVFMLPHLANARRGPLYPAIMVLLLVPPMATKTSPNRLLFCGSLFAAGLAMLLFLQIRSVLYSGGNWGDAISTLNVNAAIEDRGLQAEDNEYINNCQLIGTIFKNGKYQYGTGQWVPRSIWKDKPVLGEGYYSFNEMYDDIEEATGFRLLGTGASVGGVADAFAQYGVFCPLFWLLLSWGMGAVYVRARLGENPHWFFCYIGFICASHWLVSQGFTDAFVPCMFFEAVPLVVFTFFNLLPEPKGRTAKARRGAVRYQSSKPALQA
jgi:hypothetical protein